MKKKSNNNRGGKKNEIKKKKKYLRGICSSVQQYSSEWMWKSRVWFRWKSRVWLSAVQGNAAETTRVPFGVCWPPREGELRVRLLPRGLARWSWLLPSLLSTCICLFRCLTVSPATTTIFHCTSSLSVLSSVNFTALLSLPWRLQFFTALSHSCLSVCLFHCFTVYHNDYNFSLHYFTPVYLYLSRYLSISLPHCLYPRRLQLFTALLHSCVSVSVSSSVHFTASLSLPRHFTALLPSNTTFQTTSVYRLLLFAHLPFTHEYPSL